MAVVPTVVNEDDLIGLMTLEKHGLIDITTPSSTPSPASSSALMVTSGCGEVIGNIENGSLMLSSETKEENERISLDANNKNNTKDQTMISYWETSSKIKFDHDDDDGHVVFLDIGGKRLHKGLSFDIVEIFGKFTKLQTLNIAGTDLPINDILKILLSTIKTSLECLYCGGNGLGNEGSNIIANQWLISSSSILRLTKLDLRYNDIGNDGIKYICDSLTKSTTKSKLEYLYLEGNNISDDGALAISNLLKSPINSALSEIYLGANSIQSIGARYLAEGLRSPNCGLTKLYLEGNNIGPEGANAFSIVLEELDGNTNLKYLYVDNNNIGKEGSNRLAKALKSNTTIIGDTI